MGRLASLVLRTSASIKFANMRFPYLLRDAGGPKSNDSSQLLRLRPLGFTLKPACTASSTAQALSFIVTTRYLFRAFA